MRDGDRLRAGGVTLTLTTNDPLGPCGPVSDQVRIAFDAPTVHVDDRVVCSGVGPATQDVSMFTHVSAGTETNNAAATASGAQACDNLSHCAASPANIGGNQVDRKAPGIHCDAAPSGSIPAPRAGSNPRPRCRRAHHAPTR